MQTAFDAPIQTLDVDERSFVAMLREHGWYRTEVSADDDNVGFSYTTGLWVSAQRPELIIFSMKGDIVHDVFWDLYRDAKAGIGLPLGRRTDKVFGNSPAYIFPVAKRHYRDHLGWSRWFYRGDEFPCLQIVWPDRGGIFPWEAGFEPGFLNSQPDLTEQGWLASLAD